MHYNKLTLHSMSKGNLGGFSLQFHVIAISHLSAITELLTPLTTRQPYTRTRYTLSRWAIEHASIRRRQ